MPHSWADDTVLERERERRAVIADAFAENAESAAAVRSKTDEMLWLCDLASAGTARAIAERIRHPASESV